MPLIYSYGEDALTLWVLSSRLGQVLKDKPLEDDTPPADCLRFFRISFGRNSKGKTRDGGAKELPSFGEFDFIVASKKRLYLGETKWSGSSDWHRRTCCLGPEQVRRHEVFKWYLREWFQHPWKDWGEFWSAHGGTLMVGDLTKPIPKAKHQLIKTLLAVLTRLHKYYDCKIPKVTDVLLYVHFPEDTPKLESVDGFKVVKVLFDRPLSDDIVPLDCRPTKGA